ncbi:MAG TPA: response regulator [Marinobacterium sp.]|nr:response regulator [Marinobacterium sp.]
MKQQSVSDVNRAPEGLFAARAGSWLLFGALSLLCLATLLEFSPVPYGADPLTFVLLAISAVVTQMLRSKENKLRQMGRWLLVLSAVLSVIPTYHYGVIVYLSMPLMLLITISALPKKLAVVGALSVFFILTLGLVLGGYQLSDSTAMRVALNGALLILPLSWVVHSQDMVSFSGQLSRLFLLSALALTLINLLTPTLSPLLMGFVAAVLIVCAWTISQFKLNVTSRRICAACLIVLINVLIYQSGSPYILAYTSALSLTFFILLPAVEGLLVSGIIIASSMALFSNDLGESLNLWIKNILISGLFILTLFALVWSRKKTEKNLSLNKVLITYLASAAIFAVLMLLVNLSDFVRAANEGFRPLMAWLSPHLVLWMTINWLGYSVWISRATLHDALTELTQAQRSSELALDAAKMVLFEVDQINDRVRVVGGKATWPDIYKMPLMDAFSSKLSDADLERFRVARQHPGTEVEVAICDPDTGRHAYWARVGFSALFERNGRRYQMLYRTNIETEVAHRLSAQRALSQLQQSTEGGHIGLFYHDIKNDLFEVNSVYRELRALPAERYPQIRLEDVVSRVAPECREAYVQDVMAARERLTENSLIETTLRLPDGSERYQHILVRPLCRDGELIAMSGTVHDITERIETTLALERKAAEQAELLEQLQREILSVRLISQAAHVARWIYSAQTEQLSLSEDVLRLFDIKETVEIRELADLAAFIEASDREQFTSVLKRLAGLMPVHLSKRQLDQQDLPKLTSATYIDSEPFRVASDNARVRWVKLVCSRYKLEGELQHTLGCFIDVSDEVHEQRKAEQRFAELRAAAEQVNLHIFEEDLILHEGRFITDPSHFPSQTGVPLVGASLYNAVPRQYHVEVERCYDEPGYTAEFPIQLAQQQIWVRQQVVRKFTRGAQQLATVILEDRTEDHLAQTLVQTSLNEQELLVTELEAQRERQRLMFAMIGHEVRTPAATLHMLLEQQEVSKLLPHGSEIADTSDHLLSVLNDLRAVVRKEGSELGEVTTDNPVELIYRALKPVQKLFDEAGMCIRVQTNQVNHVQLTGNFQALRQIITNLAKNAVLYSGGSELHIKASTLVEGERVRLNLVVEDTGKGVSPEFQPKLFDPFERNDADRDGTGLGLFICRDLARKMDGELTYSDAEGGGAQFCVTALFNPYGDRLNIASSAEEESQQESSPLMGLRVLVAEDNAMLQMLTRKLLEGAGAEVDLATNGVEALERLKSNPFDLLISDIFMPQMDGYALSQAVRQLGYSLPIIGVSAATIGEETDKMLAAGADFVIPKPLNKEALVQVLDRIKARDMA